MINYKQRKSKKRGTNNHKTTKTRKKGYYRHESMWCILFNMGAQIRSIIGRVVICILFKRIKKVSNELIHLNLYFHGSIQQTINISLQTKSKKRQGTNQQKRQKQARNDTLGH